MLPAPRKIAIAAAAAAITAAQPALAEGTLFGGSWPEAGGWGQAWGDDPLPMAPPAPAARTPLPPSLSPQQVAPLTFSPVPPMAQPAPVAKAADEPPKRTPRTQRPPAAEQTGNEPTKERDIDQPVHITADQIIHDRDLDIVTAKGRVDILQAGRTLTADVVSYNLKQDVITASGNVVIAEPTGETTFADYFELTGDFKNGVAHEIKVLMADRSRMAAASATRIGGNRTDFDKAVYTPCEPCRDKPDQVPLWQTKAERVTHNQTEQLIEYRDVWMEIEGIPVAYTPYLSTPDPTVKRRSGFLAPAFSSNTSVGWGLTTPYYFVLSGQEDLTLSPRWLLTRAATTQAGTYESPKDLGNSALQHVVLDGEHRWAGNIGQTRTTASLTEDQATGNIRGNVVATGKFDFDTHWRGGWDIARQSDDTYSRMYNYPVPMDKPWLTSRVYTEGFGRRDYAVAEGFAFQGITNSDDNIDRSPLVLPHLAYSHISSPDRWGGSWRLDGDALAYARVEGTSADRLSQQVAWVRPFTSALGEQYTLTASVRGDGFHSDALPGFGTAEVGRVYPTLAVDWRLPFVNSSSTLPQVVTPMAMVAASPVGGNSLRMPNEDSTDFELDEINVFRPNRLPGLDRVEGGLRGAYGFRYAAYPYQGGELVTQLAQGWRAHADSTFAPNSGFSGTLSDYLGKATFTPVGNFSLFDRFRLDRDSFHTERNEAGMSAGPRTLNGGVAYGYFEKATAQNASNGEEVFPRRHYIAASLGSAMSQYWSVSTSSMWDMANNGNNLNWGAHAIYNDECFALTSNFVRNFTTDRNYLAGYSITFMIVFKTFGQVPVSAF